MNCETMASQMDMKPSQTMEKMPANSTDWSALRQRGRWINQGMDAQNEVDMIRSTATVAGANQQRAEWNLPALDPKDDPAPHLAT